MIEPFKHRAIQKKVKYFMTLFFQAMSQPREATGCLLRRVAEVAVACILRPSTLTVMASSTFPVGPDMTEATPHTAVEGAEDEPLSTLPKIILSVGVLI